MNGSFYQKPTFPTIEDDFIPETIGETSVTKNDNSVDLENKNVKIYVSFSNNSPWQNKIYECKIINNEVNYYLIQDINNIKYLIKKSNIDYIEFI